ncbi:MAG TPA: DUF2007 domain-containing protein [Flavobacteriales bacterium]|nr:DUF2007 domain-containing protein [Flavobacteriales bacterium]
MGNWTLVFRAGSSQEAEIVRGLLEEHDIRAVVMDQGSSAYPPLGESAVYVDRDDVLRALYLVRKEPEA